MIDVACWWVFWDIVGQNFISPKWPWYNKSTQSQSTNMMRCSNLTCTWLDACASWRFVAMAWACTASSIAPPRWPAVISKDAESEHTLCNKVFPFHKLPIASWDLVLRIDTTNSAKQDDLSVACQYCHTLYSLIIDSLNSYETCQPV